MPNTWTEAPQEVIQLAEELIQQHHPWLRGANIGILFRSKAPKNGGRRTLGAASRASAMMNALFPDERQLDFVIWLAKDAWEEDLIPAQQRALLDHELCHCLLVEGEFRLRPHDVEEFRCIVQRHGLWKADLERFAEAFQQHRLPGLEPLQDFADRNGAVVTIKPGQLMPQEIERGGDK